MHNWNEINLTLWGGHIQLRVMNNGRMSRVRSNLRDADHAARETPSPEFLAACKAVETMVLHHLRSGIDIQSPEYLEGLESAFDDISAAL